MSSAALRNTAAAVLHAESGISLKIIYYSEVDYMEQENNYQAVFHNRPEGERLPVEAAVYELLERLDIDFYGIDHPSSATMESCEHAGELLGVRLCKNLFLCNRQKTKYFLLILPADKDFHTKDITGQIKCSRLSFAGDEPMMELLGVAPGSVTVMGLMNDHENRVQLVIDEELLGERLFACHPCINTSSIAFSTYDLLNKLLPAVGHDFLTVRL